MEEIMPDRTHYKWDINGNVIGLMFANGVYREYYEDSPNYINFDELPDGTHIYYFDDNKTIKSKHRLNGTIITYYESGGIEQLILPDGTCFKWREDGTMASIEMESDGFFKEFYDDGTPKHAEDANGFIQDWDAKGRVINIEDPDADYCYIFKFYRNGMPKHEEDSNGLTRDWNRQGILIYEEAPVTGRHFEANEDGTPILEYNPDGEREWDNDGNLIYSSHPENNDGYYDDDSYDYMDAQGKDNDTLYQTTRVTIPQAEIDDVRSQYQNTELWLKAPNGQTALLVSLRGFRLEHRALRIGSETGRKTRKMRLK